MQDAIVQMPMTDASLRAIEKALNRLRLERHVRETPYAVAPALEAYYWNCELAAAFSFPLHVVEVVCRNAVQGTLRARLKAPWYRQTSLLTLLGPQYRDALESVIDSERRQHGAALTDDHIVSSLTFGFWEHLTTKRFDRLLWARGIKHPFPNAYAAQVTIRDVSARIQTVRQWRNRVFHHRVLFDRGPEQKLTDIVMLIGWVCRDTADWVWRANDVQKLLRTPPLIISVLDAPPP